MSNLRIYTAICTFLPLVGGAEKQALEQSRNLRERGHETTIITLRHDRAWPRREIIEGVPVIRVAGALLGGREKLPRPLAQFLYLMALVMMGWTFWRYRRQYDVLHIHQLNMLALPAAIACRLTGKPMLVVVHSAGQDMNALWASGKPSLLAGPLDATTPWLQVSGRLLIGGDLANLERLGKPLVRFTRSLLQSMHAVLVVISSRMKGYLAARDFYLPDIQLIPNGVDAARFNATDLDISFQEREQVIICISRLSYEKGIDVLLQAWSIVLKQSPQSRLIIVGKGDLRPQLECMASALGIADCVEFAGLQEDIPAQLHRAAVAVLPSRVEGMPVALLEAMACGLACVATRVSGSEDIIEHGVNGLLVEPEDYQGMAQELLALLHDPALVQQYGRAARTTVEKRYSLEQVTNMYIALYEQMIHRREADHEGKRSCKFAS